MSVIGRLWAVFASGRGRHAPVRQAGGLAVPTNQREAVEWRIAELADAGALDEGNADVLDQLIDAWHAQQVHRIDAYYIDRRRDRETELLHIQHQLHRAEQAHVDAVDGVAGLTATPTQVAGPQSGQRSGGRAQRRASETRWAS